MIYLGDTQLNTFPLGDTQPLSAYLGSTLVWPDGTPPSPYTGQYLTFIAQEAGTFKFSGSPSTNKLQYSLDSGTTWTTLPHNTNSPTVQSGASIMWRTPGRLGHSNFDPYGIGRFISSGRFIAEGNSMSILYDTDFSTQDTIPYWLYGFGNLFNGVTGLTSAENLILPATALTSDYCYGSMFAGCTSLTTAPELPATTLSDYCYQSMFAGCTSLTTAPELPAMEIKVCSYDSMFARCTSLTTAPELPATTLNTGSYIGMFNQCSGLVTPPSVLPATTLKGGSGGLKGCYQSMFNGCSSLTAAPSMTAATVEPYCCNSMFLDCYSLADASGIKLSATTLDDGCYTYMFYNCTSLTAAPELPATALTAYCYQSMFSYCQSLDYIKCLAKNGINSNNSTTNWLNGVSSSGTFVKASSATWPTGGNGIPNNWTVQSE